MTAPGPDATALGGGRALDRLNFLFASSQTGFGAFIAVYLTAQAWTQSDIGAALSIGTVVAMVSQVPAGALVDAMRSKRLAIGLGGMAIAFSAVLLATWPAPLPIYLAEILHGFASCMIGPAIAAISLDLVRAGEFGRRLGRNAQFSAIGNGIAAGVLGAVGSYVSDGAVFWLTAALMVAGVLSLRGLPAGKRGAAGRAGPAGGTLRALRGLIDRRLIVFVCCLAAFHLGNAAMLPTVAGEITRQAGSRANLVIAASIVVPQLVVAVLSGPAGALAERWGRRPVLFMGFAALPVRGILLSTTADPLTVVAVQALDGISGAALGVLLPLLAADLAAAKGAFNLCMGVFGLAVGVGATLSTLLAGRMADQYGPALALLALAMAGAVALVGLLAMPETKPGAMPSSRAPVRQEG